MSIRMSESLPDSGGAYMDRASGPITGTARRTWESFKGETLSGNAGAEAAKYVVGGGLAAGVYYVINRAFDANAGDS